MLSAQIDELRAMAQLEKNLERPAIARILGDAADTILELRDDLQRANDAVRDAEHDESRAWDRVRKAESENEKLRKLAQEMHPYAKAYMYLVRQLGHIDDLSYEWAMQLQKLGIEVPE